MNLAPVDLIIIAVYLLLVVALGVWIHRRATRGLAAYYLGDRNLPWWLLGLAGCSSYIDIGGTMGMVGLLYYTGLKGVWFSHVFWGWFIICFYMAFQARWIRRSGVMTFAEWNVTRFGDGRAAERARVASAVFLLVLMVFNLTFIAVGIGKFAEEFLPLERWQSTALVFGCVAVYTTLGGFFGVVLTDVLQTVLIAAGAVLLAVMAWQAGDPAPLIAAKDPAWSSLAPAWSLWPSYAGDVGPHPDVASYLAFGEMGPVLFAGAFWLVFRVLAGPNVWDFQFFLTARSPRDAQLAGGLWTVGYTLRWIIGVSFLVLGLHWLRDRGGAFDGEKVMPLVVLELPFGVRGLFIALLLAALMSTLDAMVNVTSSVVVNDFAKRYWRGLDEKALVRCGQVASLLALLLAFAICSAFRSVTAIWQTMVFVVVTTILVPATLRWHWWRFGPAAFAWGMAGTAAWIAGTKVTAGLLDWPWPDRTALPVYVGGSLVWCVALGLLTRPAPRDVLHRFYAGVRPFGLWGPVRRECVGAGLVPADDRTPRTDVVNGVLAAGLQVGICLVPFYGLLGMTGEAAAAAAVVGVLGVVLYFTWYRTLPARE